MRYLMRIISFIAGITAANFCIGIGNMIIAAQNDFSINYLGLINIVLGLWGTFGVIRLLKKHRKMKQEGQVFE